MAYSKVVLTGVTAGGSTGSNACGKSAVISATAQHVADEIMFAPGP
jgi:hypothetical protein